MALEAAHAARPEATEAVTAAAAAVAAVASGVAAAGAEASETTRGDAVAPRAAGMDASVQRVAQEQAATAMTAKSK